MNPDPIPAKYCNHGAAARKNYQLTESVVWQDELGDIITGEKSPTTLKKVITSQ